MIELYVNNREVILPKGFSFTLVENNPEINSEGDFSLDMTVSLREPQNAVTFGFVNRKNLTVIPTKYDNVKLIYNGRTIFGSIIDPKNTDIDLTFQFVAGNSELNYVIQNDKRKIWELDWGTESGFPKLLNDPDSGYVGNNASATLEHTYEDKYILPPVKLSDQVVNDYTYYDREGRIGIEISAGEIVLQPFLLYYINKFPELLGYTLLSNILNDDERAKKIYLINSVNSGNYSDFLPDWTIPEFVDAVETFFNVSFKIDSSTKSCNIVSLNTNLETKKQVKIDKVLDDYIRDSTQGSKSSKLDFSRLVYDATSDTYFKYQQLSDSLLSKMTVVPFDDYYSLQMTVRNSSETLYDKMKIYRDMETDSDYYIIRSNATLIPSINLYRRVVTNIHDSVDWELILINKFRPTDGDKTNDLTLKIQPAAVVRNTKTTEFTYIPTNYHFTGDYFYQLPKTDAAYQLPATFEFIDSVENGEKSISRKSVMEIALFTGLLIPYSEEGLTMGGIFYPVVLTEQYPFSHIDILPEFGYGDKRHDYTRFKNLLVTPFQVLATETLRLTGLNGILADYHPAKIIDTSEEYTFYLTDTPDIRSNNIFIIDNLKYMPVAIERQISETQKTIKLTCYRMLV